MTNTGTTKKYEVENSIFSSKLVYNTSVSLGLLEGVYRDIPNMCEIENIPEENTDAVLAAQRAVLEVHAASIVLQDAIGYFTDDTYLAIGEYANDILVLLHDSELLLNVLTENHFSSDFVKPNNECKNLIYRIAKNLENVLLVCETQFGEGNPFFETAKSSFE